MNDVPMAAEHPAVDRKVLLDAVEDNERATQVQRAIAQLSESLRVVLILREYQDLSYQEIANVLDIPIGTVMSRLNSARAQLRHELLGLLE